jgi:hypothetical protein
VYAHLTTVKAHQDERYLSRRRRRPETTSPIDEEKVDHPDDLLVGRLLVPKATSQELDTPVAAPQGA